jgi:BirA family transcriptional regulator, biotin operon repressor / biotin---[acetyl-CoA-carboxylase] ligase
LKTLRVFNLISMNLNELKKFLSKLPLGDVRYFETIGSTNDEALAWAANDTPDLSVVIADEQTAGRGRLDRKWFTPKGTALAFSIVLRPTPEERPHLTRVVGLAALAAAEALRKGGLDARIKWPNDILIRERKVCGILIESVWSGDDVDCVVIGIGVNVFQGAIPPAELLQFPATSLESELGQAPEREEILRDILAALIDLRPRLGTDEFLKQWEDLLALRGEAVQVEMEKTPEVTGQISGLESDGSLVIRNEHGEFVTVRFGDVRLRPLA